MPMEAVLCWLEYSIFNTNKPWKCKLPAYHCTSPSELSGGGEHAIMYHVGCLYVFNSCSRCTHPRSTTEAYYPSWLSCEFSLVGVIFLDTLFNGD